MGSRGAFRLKVIGTIALIVALVAITAAATPVVRGWLKPPPDATNTSAEAGATRLAGRDTVCFNDPALVQALGVTVARAEKPKASRPLELPGSLAWDTDRIAPVRSRFPGEVVEIARVRDPESAGRTQFRPLRAGDVVEENQLLAVVWSKDLGQTKSALVDALSKLRTDQETLERYKDLYYNKNALPERSLREAERTVESDKIAVAAAELTLRSWRLSDKEIAAIHREAEQVIDLVRKGKKGQDAKELARQREDWARVEVRAPIAGTILEKNLANANSAIVDTSTNLFIIGDLSRLMVWAWAFEEDLPRLQALPRPIPWTIRLKAAPDAPPLRGTVSEIRPVIDPTVHAALVKGYVDNPREKLLAGQYVTASVPLPARPNEVVVPTSALVEDGRESIVFVQPDPGHPCYSLRHVAVVRRSQDVVHLRWVWPDVLTFLSSIPDPGAPASLALAALFQGSQNDFPNPLRSRIKPEQEWVVTSGALELRGELNDLIDRQKTKQ